MISIAGSQRIFSLSGILVAAELFARSSTSSCSSIRSSSRAITTVGSSNYRSIWRCQQQSLSRCQDLFGANQDTYRQESRLVNQEAKSQSIKIRCRSLGSQVRRAASRIRGDRKLMIWDVLSRSINQDSLAKKIESPGVKMPHLKSRYLFAVAYIVLWVFVIPAPCQWDVFKFESCEPSKSPTKIKSSPSVAKICL